MRAVLFALLMAGLAAGQISPPSIGYLRDRSGALRPLTGIAGVFILGEPVLDGVLSAGSSGRYAAVKTAGEVILFDNGTIIERREVNSGPALFTFDRHGRLSTVTISETDENIRWGNGNPLRAPVRIDADEVEISESGVRLRLPERCAEPEQIGDGWVAVRGASGIYAIRTLPGQEAVYRLPEPAR
jgi:hypothetical protein